MAYSHNGIVCSSKNEEITTIHDNMIDSYKYNIEQIGKIPLWWIVVALAGGDRSERWWLGGLEGTIVTTVCSLCENTLSCTLICIYYTYKIFNS